ncbi:hypothetical protein INR49_008607 [Caranx melampygus]|nr:hypothetical protein INR49_008607 [Caranx melampygus]
MVEGKPYRYGLIAAGLCVAAVGLFIMTQERPHIYTTMCVLGVSMIEEKSEEDLAPRGSARFLWPKVKKQQQTSPRGPGEPVSQLSHTAPGLRLCRTALCAQDRDRAPHLNNLFLDNNITHISC